MLRSVCCVQATADDHIAEAQKAIASLQVQFKSERDKFIKIRTDLQSTKNSSHSHEAHVHLLTIQINDLQVINGAGILMCTVLQHCNINSSV